MKFVVIYTVLSQHKIGKLPLNQGLFYSLESCNLPLNKCLFYNSESGNLPLPKIAVGFYHWQNMKFNSCKSGNYIWPVVKSHLLIMVNYHWTVAFSHCNSWAWEIPTERVLFALTVYSFVRSARIKAVKYADT